MTSLTAHTLCEGIVALVNERDHVTFSELVHKWREHFDAPSGEESYDLYVPDYNCVYWSNVSRLGAEALSLGRDKQFLYEPCTLMPYVVDGTMLTLPVVKRARRYKKLHWLPVVLRPTDKKRWRTP